MVDAVGEPMNVAQYPWLDARTSMADRIGDALIGALRETLRFLPRSGAVLFVNLPMPRPGLPEDLVSRVRGTVDRAFPEVFANVTFAQQGHAGCLLALQTVQATLGANADVACVVAGADSYLDPDTLEWLEDTGQFHGAGERNNAWGFVPGEGAGAILLLSRHAAGRSSVHRYGRINAVGIGRETHVIRSGAVNLGLGLTQAFRGAFAGLSPGETITDIYCDMNGEPYRADEFGFAIARTRENFRAPSDFVAPADCWGDVGAASATLLCVMACVAGAKRYAKGGRHLVWASSESGERGATVIDTSE